MHHSSRGYPTTSGSHSPLELEHRLTIGEMEAEATKEQLAGLQRRMSLVEKAILAILGCLQVLLQDKYPALAALLKGLIP